MLPQALVFLYKLNVARYFADIFTISMQIARYSLRD